MMRSSHVFLTLCAAGVTLAAPALLCAELTEIVAEVEARTDQRVSGEPASFETAFEAFPGTTNLLPAEAETALVRTELFGGAHVVVGQGRALAVFSEPQVADLTNPGDIGVSAVAFSTAAGVGYRVSGKVFEAREFFFDADEAGEPDGTEIELDSDLFLNGGFVIWGETDVTDLSGATIDGSIQIVQKRAGLPDTTLVTIEVALVGQSDGTVTATLSANLNGVPIDVVAIVDPPSGPLAGATGGQVDLPSLIQTFTYPAIVGGLDSSDARFKLEAVVEVQCDNGPGGGIGAAAVLGAPLFGPTDSSAALARAITETITDVAPARAITGNTPFAALTNLCGVLGIETALALLLCGASYVVRSRATCL